MGLALITAASSPVTTALAKSHLRVDGSTEDALIGALLGAAVKKVEGRTHRALGEQTWEYSLPCFPADGIIRLPKPPLIAVSSVKYLDENGTEQTLSTDDYVVTTSTLPGQVTRADGSSWPTTSVHPEAVRVRFVCGYAETIPEELTAAILLELGDLYANREAKFVGTIQTENPTVEALCGPYLYREAV